MSRGEKVLLSGPDLEAYQQVLAEVNERDLGETGVVISIPEQDIHAPKSPLSGLQERKSDGNEINGEESTGSKMTRGTAEQVHIFRVRTTLRIVRNLHPKDAGNAFDEIRKAA